MNEGLRLRDAIRRIPKGIDRISVIAGDSRIHEYIGGGLLFLFHKVLIGVALQPSAERFFLGCRSFSVTTHNSGKNVTSIAAYHETHKSHTCRSPEIPQ